MGVHPKVQGLIRREGWVLPLDSQGVSLAVSGSFTPGGVKVGGATFSGVAQAMT